MKTYAVWMLLSWNINQGFMIHEPYFPNFQECETVRKVAEDIATGKYRCVRSDVLQTIERGDIVRTK